MQQDNVVRIMMVLVRRSFISIFLMLFVSPECSPSCVPACMVGVCHVGNQITQLSHYSAHSYTDISVLNYPLINATHLLQHFQLIKHRFNLIWNNFNLEHIVKDQQYLQKIKSKLKNQQFNLRISGTMQVKLRCLHTLVEQELSFMKCFQTSINGFGSENISY